MKQFNEYPLAHVGFVVKDAQATANKFKELFGIDDFQVYDFSPTRAWSYGKEITGYKLKIAMAKMPGKDTKIEVIQPVSNEGLHLSLIHILHKSHPVLLKPHPQAQQLLHPSYPL